MPVYTDQQKVLDNDLIEERVKQIVLDVFFSFYVRRDLQDIMEKISDDIQYIGTRDVFVSHNKDEFFYIWNREMEKVPQESVVKVISADAATIGDDCYSVNGVLEIRIPHTTCIEYQNLRFQATVLLNGKDYKIAAMHTAVREA